MTEDATAPGRKRRDRFDGLATAVGAALAAISAGAIAWWLGDHQPGFPLLIIIRNAMIGSLVVTALFGALTLGFFIARRSGTQPAIPVFFIWGSATVAPCMAAFYHQLVIVQQVAEGRKVMDQLRQDLQADDTRFWSELSEISVPDLLETKALGGSFNPVRIKAQLKTAHEIDARHAAYFNNRIAEGRKAVSALKMGRSARVQISRAFVATFTDKNGSQQQRRANETYLIGLLDYQEKWLEDHRGQWRASDGRMGLASSNLMREYGSLESTKSQTLNYIHRLSDWRGWS